MEQQTLAGTFALEGVGIHTGAQGRVTVTPAEAGAGRVFRVGSVTIPARAEFVIDTSRSTRLGRDGATVSTVEHLLSALHAFGVDNAVIVVEGPEIPILDGSAAPFAEAIRRVGVRGQNRPARTLILETPVVVEQGGTRLAAKPATGLNLRVRTEFDAWPEGRAECRVNVGPAGAAAYCADIGPARTFAFRSEVELLLQAGLAQGGSLENALIITPPNSFSTPLRLPQEWCAHKMLDLVGDLALADARLELRVDALRPGHRANVAFVTALSAHSRTKRDQENRMDCTLDIEDIRALLPHRYPMLLVDRVLELTPGKHVVGLKNVTINEPFFDGHFPAQAIMPGVLILESMAQVAGLMMLSLTEQRGRIPFLAAMDKVKFRKPVVPGDALVTEANLIKVRGMIGKVRMVARVAGAVVAECDMTFALKEAEPHTPEKVLDKLRPGRPNPVGSVIPPTDATRADAHPTDEGDSNRV